MKNDAQKIKVWVVGGEGMLGKELANLLQKNNIDHIATGSRIDIRDRTMLTGFSEDKNITHVVNCAAYTNVDDAEDVQNRYAADSLNALGPENLALLAKERNYSLIHISTDYVFNGKSNVPLDEKCETEPVGFYGKTKLAGEHAIARSACAHYILRTSWLYGQYGKNFVDTMLTLMNEKDALSIVGDQYGSPTWTVDLCRAILAILQYEQKGQTAHGIYHFSDNGETTWYAFAQAIKEKGQALGLINHDCRLSQCTTEDYPTKAQRPHYSLLSKEKIMTTFHLDIPSWQDSLQQYLSSKGNPS